MFPYNFSVNAAAANFMFLHSFLRSKIMSFLFIWHDFLLQKYLSQNHAQEIFPYPVVQDWVT